jgi:hypothetical protein
LAQRCGDIRRGTAQHYGAIVIRVTDDVDGVLLPSNNSAAGKNLANAVGTKGRSASSREHGQG